jgi:predicted HTH domain antitoxin
MSTLLKDKEIDALIKKGIYKDKDSLYNDALRFLFIYRPELRIESAIELYTSGEISFSKAIEIAGIDIESFKEELKRRGIKIELSAPEKKIIKKGVAAILKK